MKIKCEVLAVATNGDELAITAQGDCKGSARWRRMSSIKIEVPDTKPSRQAFHVGRMFDITLSLK